jgi:hypothetical protein
VSIIGVLRHIQLIFSLCYIDEKTWKMFHGRQQVFLTNWPAGLARYSANCRPVLDAVAGVFVVFVRAVFKEKGRVGARKEPRHFSHPGGILLPVQTRYLYDCNKARATIFSGTCAALATLT